MGSSHTIASFVFLIAAALVSGCGQTPVSKQQEALKSDSLTLKGADALLAPPQEAGQGIAVASGALANMTVVAEAASVDPAGSSASPKAAEIQKALKNLGLYEGEIDGKIGPRTKEAIREFQKKNNLKPDGKVGAQTWPLLKKALTP